MTESIDFLVKIGRETKDDVERLNRLLQYLGGKAKLVDFDNKSGCITISYDEYDAKMIRTRRAGKYHVRLQDPVPVSKVKEMIKGTSANDAAKALGMSTPTMYRKLKKAREEEKDYIQ